MLLTGIVTALMVSGAMDAARAKILAAKSKADHHRWMLERAAVGAAALEDGIEKEIPQIDLYTEVPPDPAFAGAAVLLTSSEVIWWMSASVNPQDHIPEIRRILQEQPLRRAVCSVL